MQKLIDKPSVLLKISVALKKDPNTAGENYALLMYVVELTISILEENEDERTSNVSSQG